MTERLPLCPKCGEPLDFDEVDIGVGVQRGNFRCPACNWNDKRDSQAKAPGFSAGDSVGWTQRLNGGVVVQVTGTVQEVTDVFAKIKRDAHTYGPTLVSIELKRLKRVG